jgi:ABC-2 type transport system permease protein
MSFATLFRKELREYLKTYKFLIVVAVFLFFGLSAPIIIKLLPDILKMSGQQIPLTLPTFGPVDALKSYVSNFSQIGLLVAVLVATGAIAQERERGTAIMTMCKPVGFGAFILAKLAALVLTFGIGIALGAIGCYYYTVLLLGSVDVGAFVAMNLLAIAYLVVCLSVTLMYSSLFRNQLAAGGLAFATLIGMVLLSSIPVLSGYLPSALMGWAAGLAAGGSGSSWSALFVSAGIVVAAIVVSWQTMTRKEL